MLKLFFALLPSLWKLKTHEIERGRKTEREYRTFVSSSRVSFNSSVDLLVLCDSVRFLNLRSFNKYKNKQWHQSVSKSFDWIKWIWGLLSELDLTRNQKLLFWVRTSDCRQTFFYWFAEFLGCGTKNTRKFFAKIYKYEKNENSFPIERENLRRIWLESKVSW